jgi:prepilin-type N-terminal cleavage/methylation domain-containing protein
MINRKKTQRGFTMIELMISVAISTFVVFTLYGIFTIQTYQLMNQELRMEMHQNSRFALEILSRSTRMSGFGTRGTIVGEFGNNGGTSNVQDVIVSYDAIGSDGSDAITVAYMEPSLVMDTKYSTVEACATSTITFDPNHLDNFDKLLQFQSDDLLMCYDYAAIGTNNTYLWSITSDVSTTTPFGAVAVDSSIATATDFAAACPSGYNISPVIRCSKGHLSTYYIDDTDNGVGPGSPEHPVLMMDLNDNFPNNDDVPLVDNIEDLQFQYCIDDGTNIVNCASPLSWVSTIPAGEISNVWMVRISMVVRSPKENYQGMEWSTNVRPAVANNAAGSSGDGYYREVVTTEVTVRNLRLF